MMMLHAKGLGTKRIELPFHFDWRWEERGGHDKGEGIDKLQN
jgi:hypothetical protein